MKPLRNSAPATSSWSAATRWWCRRPNTTSPAPQRRGREDEVQNLLTGAPSESVPTRPTTSSRTVVLDHWEVTTLLFRGPDVRVHGCRPRPVRSRSDNMTDAPGSTSRDGLQVEVVFKRQGDLGRAAQQRGARGSFTPSPPSRATPRQGHESRPRSAPASRSGAAFVEIGDKIEIDTRTDEYKNRVK